MAGLTQRGLAEVSGVSYFRVMEIEHGRTAPTIAEIEALAAALKVSPGDLLPDSFRAA